MTVTGNEDCVCDGVDVNRTLGSAQLDELKAHSHDTYYAAVDGGSGGVTDGSPNGVEASGRIVETGGVETRPRNIAMYFIIKA